MRLTEPWVQRPETQAVFDALAGAGHAGYFVGGCVRNALMQEPVSDIDIATDANPDQTLKAAAAAGLKAVPTGYDHGTITVLSGDLAHEITSFRRDIETDGRHARVVYSDRIEEDAARRDFTMNALYAARDGTVIDPLGGFEDLRARHVRFIGTPEDRIREDYLRILRFFRFHAWYGDPEAGMDADALAAISENLTGLETISRERIGAEMLKLLAAPDPSRAMAGLRSTGVLAQILPGAEDRFLPILVHFELGVSEPSALRRLAALGGNDLQSNLRLSKAQTARLSRLREGAGGTQPAAELGYRDGIELAQDILLLRAALFETPPKPGDISAATRAAAMCFPVRAVDLMPIFSGPALGNMLKDLEADWIASGFTLTRAQLLTRSRQ